MPILSRRTLSAFIGAYRGGQRLGDIIAHESLALPVELAIVSHCHALLAAAIRFGLLGHSVIAFPSPCSVKLAHMEGAAAGVIMYILSLHLAVRRVCVTRNITPGVTSITFAAFALVIIVIGNAGLFAYVRDAALLALAATTNASRNAHLDVTGLHGTLG